MQGRQQIPWNKEPMMEINNHGAHSTRACCLEIHWNSCSLHVIILLISEHQEPFCESLVCYINHCKTDSTDIKPHRNYGDFSSPQLSQSLSILIFLTPPLYFPFLRCSGVKCASSSSDLDSFLFAFKIICQQSLILYHTFWLGRHSWKSGTVKVGSQVLHINLFLHLFMALAVSWHCVNMLCRKRCFSLF